MKLNLDKAAPQRPLVPVLYDITRPHGLVLEVKGDSRSERAEQLKVDLATEAQKSNANLQKIQRLAERQIDESIERLNKFCRGWRRMTPAVLQEVCAGGRRALTDERVAELEQELTAAGETEYAFDEETYIGLLEDCPVFRLRLASLANDTAALVEAEEACRKNACASGSSTPELARA